LELERGSTLGSYELLVRIGRGGMAGVWVARGRPHPGEPEQLVAVKAMLPELASNMEFRSMFLDEGQIVRSIDHPNVVRVYDVGEAHGVLYMAMEWVEGDSLHTLIAEANKRRPIPPEVAVRLIADTAAGLHAAHELRGWDGQLKEVVHCDVSPHNILIGLDGVVKLVDFGVAGAMNQISTDDEVKIRGKFGYMSPEQAQAKPLDRRSDVFSLGIVLFELTTGYRLFRGRDDRHTLELVTFGKIPRPSQVIARYPERLEAIVLKALERDLDKRFQTADEFRDALETYLVEERILVPAAGVKGMLRRVLGSKIDQRRQQIRGAIRSLDGSQAVATLVSEESVLPDEEAVSVSVSGADPPSDPSYSQSSSSKNLGAAFLPGDGSSGVQTLSQPSLPPGRSNKLMLLGAGIGVVLAGATFLLVGLRPTQPEVHELHPTTQVATIPTASPGHPAANPAHPAQPEGLSIDSLPAADPVAAASAAAAAERAKQPGAPATPAPATPAPAPDDRLAKDMAEIRAEPKATEAVKVTLAEDPAKDRVAAIANAVSLDEHGTSPAPVHAPEPGGSGDFDKAAAKSALNRVAGLVGMCRRPGGATGPGEAIVAFGPSGRVQSVSVHGSVAGTPIGDCVANIFRGVKVPAFSGDAVTVSKAFVIPD
jgi:eukaryotic-like serine/threonine-protein kinase